MLSSRQYWLGGVVAVDLLPNSSFFVLAIMLHSIFFFFFFFVLEIVPLRSALEACLIVKIDLEIVILLTF